MEDYRNIDRVLNGPEIALNWIIVVSYVIDYLLIDAYGELGSLFAKTVTNLFTLLSVLAYVILYDINLLTLFGRIIDQLIID